jgi:hypothetical protein
MASEPWQDQSVACRECEDIPVATLAARPRVRTG